MNKANEVTSTQAYMDLSEKLLDVFFLFNFKVNYIKNTYAHNVSFIEITHYITKETPVEQVYSDVTDVLTAFVSRNAEKIGFSE